MDNRRMIYASIAGLISLVSFYLALPEHPKAPPLILSPVAHDFGKVEGDRLLEFEASVKNTLSSSIRINQILTGCDCTTSEVRGIEVPPYGSISVPLKWHLKGRRGAISTSASVEYQFNNELPFFITKPLTLTCHVLEEYTVSPSYLVLNSSEEQARIEFHANPARPPVRIKHLESTHPAIQGVLETSSSDAARQIIVVSFSPSKWNPVGAKDVALIIHTTCEHQSTFKVPIRVESVTKSVESE